MTSKTGNKGFTLVELMVTVSILSLGLVMINGSLLRIADLIGRYNNSLLGYQWMDQKIWSSKEALFYSDLPSAAVNDTGTLFLGEKAAYWTLQDDGVPGAKGAHYLQLKLGWQQGQNFVQVTQSNYASSVS